MNKQALLPTGNSAWKCRLLLGILLLAHVPSTAHGQQLVAGDTIRVRPSQSTEPRGQWTVEQPKPRWTEWTEGTVVQLTPDTVWYQSSGSVSPISMDNADIQRPTHRDHRVAGAVIGGLAGGAIVGLVAYFETARVETAFRTNDRARQTVYGVIGGALWGGVFGNLLGRQLGRWETVELDQITVGDGNLAVSLRIQR